MKQNVSTRVVVALASVVVVALGILIYLFASPVNAAAVAAEAPRGLTAKPLRPAQIPRTKEEGMAIYRQMMHQGK
jgi:hypothetical protein